MATKAWKGAPSNTPSPYGSRLQVINSVSMMTRSQLATSAQTPRTPARELPISGRSLENSLIMFQNETNPQSIATVNATSASQPLETTPTGQVEAVNPPIDPIEHLDDINFRDNNSNLEGEPTTERLFANLKE